MKLVTTSPGGWTKTKLMLFSTQVEVLVEFGVELGKMQMTSKNGIKKEKSSKSYRQNKHKICAEVA